MRLIFTYIFLVATSVVWADDYSTNWTLSLGCPSHDATSSSGAVSIGASGFTVTGTCGRVSNGYAKFTLSGASGGTLNNSTLYPLQMGNLAIIPPVRTTDTTPLFSVAASCPTSTTDVNWMFIQSAAARTGEHFWGRSTMSPSSTTMTQHFNISGTELYNGSYSLPVGSCSSGVYDVAGSSDFQAKLYASSDWSGFYKTGPGNVSFVLPIWSIDQGLLASKTYSGIYFNAQDGSSTQYVRVTSNAGGSVFTIKPFSDAENSTLVADGTAYTETVTITAINSPLTGMMKGTISRVDSVGSSVGTTEAIGCIANDGGMGGLVVSCAGKNPLDNTKNYSVTFNYKFPSATLDPAFNTTGGVRNNFSVFNSSAHAVALQSDGKIVVAGNGNIGGFHNFMVARYTTAGALDTSFNTSGLASAWFGAGHDYGRAVAVQSDGKIVVAGIAATGSATDFGVARFTSSGALDTTFNTTGKLNIDFGGNEHATSVAIQSDGKIVVGGLDYSAGDFAVARINSNGTLDTSFSGDGKLQIDFSGSTDAANSLVIQSDGKILLGGYATVSSNIDFALARLETDGSLDTTFNSTGKVTTAIGSSTDYGNALALQSDGKIVLGGSALVTTNVFALARYNTDGTLDTSFNSTGKKTTALNVYDDSISGVGIQSDGKIVAFGSSSPGWPNLYVEDNYHDFAIVRYNSNGSVDTSLGGGSTTKDLFGYNEDSTCAGGAIQSDGKYVLVGFSSDQGPNTGFDIIRVIP